jgi:SAM-dependent methyltransferase
MQDQKKHLDGYSPAQNDIGLQSARAVAPFIVSLTGATSVIDLGCGPGNWLIALQEEGITDFFGVDQNDYGSDLRIPRERFAVADLAAPFSSSRTYDLVICMEVAEHVAEAAAPTLVRSLTALGQIVLFSAAIPSQGGTDHRNEQWPEYWRTLFAEREFVPLDCLRPRVWNLANVAWWYRQNMLLYVERAYLAAHPRLQAEAEHPPSFPLAVIHPELYIKKATAQGTASPYPIPRIMGRLNRAVRSLRTKA